MKLIKASLVIFVLAFAAAAQKSDDVLATATGHTFRLRDLTPETQKAALDLPAQLPTARAALLEKMVNLRVLDAEARAQGISTGKLLAAQKAKVPDPTEAEIKTVYDANRDQLAAFTPAQARKQIIAYLRTAPEQKAFGDFFIALKTKYKFIAGKDVNTPLLPPTEVVATVNGQPITLKEYEDFAGLELYLFNAQLSDMVIDDLNETIYSALILDEAKSLGIDAGEMIAREITNKLKDYSDEERVNLTNDLAKRLAAKYQVKVLYKAPEPPVQNISTDDDPSTGLATAQVTVVMFSDFQCSACSATHPLLKKAMAEFPGKVRFVVRDFPLESVHDNAFRAALAAGAANAQGKFFEYTELLYKHQDALDDVSLKKYAAELGLNAKQFELDFNSEKTAAEVRKDMADGDSYVINSTPTIFVNGVRVRNISYEGFKAAIAKALSK